MSYELLCGDNRTLLPSLPRQSVHAAVMAMPYWGQREYSQEGQPPPPGTIGPKSLQVWEHYLHSLKHVCTELVPVMFPTATICVSLGAIHIDRQMIWLNEQILPFLNSLGWIRHQSFIWNKPTHLPDGGRRTRQDMRDVEHFDWYINQRAVPFYDPLNMRDDKGKPYKQVWRIPTDRSRKYYRPEDGALIRHGATSPVEMMRRAIMGTTSSKGCCPICRTPWFRDYEHVGDPRKFGRNQEEDSYTGNSNRTLGKSVASFAGTEYIDHGFKKGCDCDTSEVVPCTVLDPFSGTGNTGVAAVGRRRHYIGIEINPNFHYIAGRKLAVAQDDVNQQVLFDHSQEDP